MLALWLAILLTNPEREDFTNLKLTHYPTDGAASWRVYTSFAMFGGRTMLRGWGLLALAALGLAMLALVAPGRQASPPADSYFRQLSFTLADEEHELARLQSFDLEAEASSPDGIAAFFSIYMAETARITEGMVEELDAITPSGEASEAHGRLVEAWSDVAALQRLDAERFLDPAAVDAFFLEHSGEDPHFRYARDGIAAGVSGTQFEIGTSAVVVGSGGLGPASAAGGVDEALEATAAACAELQAAAAAESIAVELGCGSGVVFKLMHAIETFQ